MFSLSLGKEGAGAWPGTYSVSMLTVFMAQGRDWQLASS